MQYQYQTAVYSVKWVHNEFLQVAMDNGLPALLVYLALWIWLGYVLIKLIKNSPHREDKLFLSFLAGAVLAILLQSTLDLSLTFPTVKNIFWVVFGAASTMGTNLPGVRITRKDATGVALMVIFIVLIPLFVADIYGKQAFNLYSSGDRYEARLAAEKALALNPLDAKMYNLLGNSGEQIAVGHKDRSQLAVPLSNYEEAVHYDNYNPEYNANLAYCYFQHGDVEKSCAVYRRLVELNPLKQDNWNNYAFALVMLAEKQVRAGDIAAAKKTCAEVETIPLKIEQHLSTLSPRAFNLKHKPQLEVSDVIRDSIVRARWLVSRNNN